MKMKVLCESKRIKLIAGFPARDVRRLMRESAGFIISARAVTKVLGLSEHLALKSLRALQVEGLVAVREGFREATERGHALAMATAAAPLSRATAERLIEQVVESAQEINRNEGLSYRVHWLALFGSSPAGAERPNDVDIARGLRTRFAGGKQRALEDERREAKGKFANASEWAVWPKLEVVKRLKAQSHRLSIQDFGSPTLEKIDHQLVFSDDSVECRRPWTCNLIQASMAGVGSRALAVG
jgi:hypothetical protein